MVWRSFEARQRGTDMPPAEIYEVLFGQPVPADITDLQAAGTTWQGYSFYLRFRTPSLEVARISHPPYEDIQCAQI